MKRRILCISFAWFGIVAALLATRALAAEHLAIPCNYFNRSGGFYDEGPCGCPRFAPAGGCTIAIDYAAALQQAFPRVDSTTRSWYAGGGTAYSHVPQAHCPSCQPAPTDGAWPVEMEDVGPGLPVNAPPRDGAGPR